MAEIPPDSVAGLPDGNDVVVSVPEEVVQNAIAQAVAEDRQNRRVATRVAYSLIGVGLLVFVLLLYNNQNAIENQVKFNRATAARLDREGADRRSQTCTTFESAHRQEVNQLTSTYAYIAQLTPEERKTTLNVFVIKGVPKMEAEAINDSDDLGVNVPPYCDDPRVGLPEPDPIVPPRPKALKKILPPPIVLQSSFDPKPNG